MSDKDVQVAPWKDTGRGYKTRKIKAKKKGSGLTGQAGKAAKNIKKMKDRVKAY